MLSRTPRANKNATESVPKRSLWLTGSLVGGVLLLMIAALIVFVLNGENDSSGTDCVRLSPATSSENVCVYLETVRGETELTEGLSGRSSLPENEGMLFDFGVEGVQCMWMKDMHIPLDMIWLDADGKVIDVEADISPESYPETFCGEGPARYVIEINAGLAHSSGLRIGQQIQL